MRKALFVLLLPILAFAILPAAAAQSADKLIDRCKKASGGKALKRIQSTVLTGSIRLENDELGRFSSKVVGPDRIRIEIDVAGSKIIECYNGASAWRQDSKGLRTLLGANAKKLRLQAIIANSRLQNLSRHKISVRSAGRETIEGHDANAVELGLSGGSVKIFFDAKTSLPIKHEFETEEGKEEIFYDDYRVVDGVSEPFLIKSKSSNSAMIIAIDKVEHNSPVDETVFLYPKTEGGKPLPDVEALLKAVESNQEKLQELREQYSFRATETEEELDGDGKIKKSTSKVYDVTPIYGDFVYKLISINGKELSASEREKEEKRIKKEIEEANRDREKKLKRKQRKDEDKDEITILDFLRITKVTSVRRETFRNYEVVAFDFEPRKGFKPKNRAENIISKLAGVFFIDEDEKQIVRLEARLTDSFKIGGGLLASLAPSSAFVFEQEKVRGEIWLPSYSEVNISAKFLLFAKINEHVKTGFSDYKKYQTDVDLKFDQSEK